MATQSPTDCHFQWPLQRVVLEGYSVRLTPIHYSHLDQLSVWSAEEDIWRYMTFAHLASKDELQAWIGTAVDVNERGTEMNFAIIDEASQSAVGTTSFYRVMPNIRGSNWERPGWEQPIGGHTSTQRQSI